MYQKYMSRFEFGNLLKGGRYKPIISFRHISDGLTDSPESPIN